MLTKGVTLKGLEVFEALAASGSVAEASRATGLSQPAVSQQMRNLEVALGVDLVDHGKRPMRLTPAGQTFLERAHTALRELRLAQSELTVMDLTHLNTLNLGMIDDFDNDLTPRLVSALADSLTKCRFKLISAPSHEITAAMQAHNLDIAVAAAPGEVLEGVIDYPLLRDPFIMVAPAGRDPTAVMEMPLLRYDQTHLIGRQIEAHLTRHKLRFDKRFEIGSQLALMALVARGVGWAITTPLGYMRAVRFHGQITAHPLPMKPFARTISLMARAEWADHVPRDVARTLRRLVEGQIVDPARDALPWLDDAFRIIAP